MYSVKSKWALYVLLYEIILILEQWSRAFNCHPPFTCTVILQAFNWIALRIVPLMKLGKQLWILKTETAIGSRLFIILMHTLSEILIRPFKINCAFWVKFFSERKERARQKNTHDEKSHKHFYERNALVFIFHRISLWGLKILCTWRVDKNTFASP